MVIQNVLGTHPPSHMHLLLNSETSDQDFFDLASQAIVNDFFIRLRCGLRRLMAMVVKSVGNPDCNPRIFPQNPNSICNHFI